MAYQCETGEKIRRTIELRLSLPIFFFSALKKWISLFTGKLYQISSIS